jgi:hypothetical protein
LSIISENLAASVSQEVILSQNHVIYPGLCQSYTFYTFRTSLSFLSCYSKTPVVLEISEFKQTNKLFSFIILIKIQMSEMFNKVHLSSVNYVNRNEIVIRMSISITSNLITGDPKLRKLINQFNRGYTSQTSMGIIMRSQ